MDFWKYYDSLVFPILLQIIRVYPDDKLKDELSKIVSWDFIQKYPNEKWNWKEISKSPNITLDVIENNPSEKWNWEEISKNPNITLEFARKNSEKVNWRRILENPGIKWKDIIQITDKQKDWLFVSSNPNITLKILRDNPDKKWDYWELSDNPHLTREFVYENSDKGWDWEKIKRRIRSVSKPDKSILNWMKNPRDTDVMAYIRNPNTNYEDIRDNLIKLNLKNYLNTKMVLRKKFDFYKSKRFELRIKRR